MSRVFSVVESVSIQKGAQGDSLVGPWTMFDSDGTTAPWQYLYKSEAPMDQHAWRDEMI